MWAGYPLATLASCLATRAASSGDVMRITSVMALHHASDGTVLVDVLLDPARPPKGVDLAWRTKHFLGAPGPRATMATVNLAHVLTAVEFAAAKIVEPALGSAGALGNELPENVGGLELTNPQAIWAAG